MLLLVVGAAVTLAASVVLKFLDIWFEGRGSRLRRGIVADLELLKAAKESRLATSEAARELERRIAIEMYAFSVAELPERVQKEIHKRAGRILLMTGVVGLVVLVALWLDVRRFSDELGDDGRPVLISMAVVAVLVGFGSGKLMASASRSLAESVVRRRHAADVVLGREGDSGVGDGVGEVE